MVLLAIVMSLASLDEPYTGTTATVSPVAMQSALLSLARLLPGRGLERLPNPGRQRPRLRPVTERQSSYPLLACVP